MEDTMEERILSAIRELCVSDEHFSRMAKMYNDLREDGLSSLDSFKRVIDFMLGA